MNDCENNDPSCLRSESGVFSLDKDGVVRHFFEVEGNAWHDTFWGVDLATGDGENHLGLILMRIRAELLAAT